MTDPEQELSTVRYQGCTKAKKFVVTLESRRENRLVEHVVCGRHRRDLERSPAHVKTEEPAHA